MTRSDRWMPITLRMLMSHSAGFQDPTWPYKQGKPWEPFEPTTWNQLVAMMPYQEIAFAPGSRYSYSNPGFIYLARVIEQLSGDPWEVYVQKNIFNPLGMTHSYFRRHALLPGRGPLAQLHPRQGCSRPRGTLGTTAPISIPASRCRTAAGTRRSATWSPIWRF